MPAPVLPIQPIQPGTGHQEYLDHPPKASPQKNHLNSMQEEGEEDHTGVANLDDFGNDLSRWKKDSAQPLAHTPLSRPLEAESLPIPSSIEDASVPGSAVDSSSSLETVPLTLQDSAAESTAILQKENPIFLPQKIEPPLSQLKPAEHLLNHSIHQEARLAFKNSSSDSMEHWLIHSWPSMPYLKPTTLSLQDLIHQLEIFQKEAFNHFQESLDLHIRFHPQHIITRSLHEYVEQQELALEGLNWEEGVQAKQLTNLVAYLQKTEQKNEENRLSNTEGKRKEKFLRGTGMAENIFYLPKNRSHSMVWAVLFSTSIACVLAAIVLLWLK
jgi:hypothetical protein